MLSFVPLEQNQAQLFINVYPSQDNPTNQTLRIFSGTSTTEVGSSIRSSTSSNNFGFGDTVQLATHNNSNFSLSSLFSSSNTKDIKAVSARIPSGSETNVTFVANATNTPTITIGSRTIANLFMEDRNTEDDMGIHVSGSSSFSFSSSQSFAWTGAGILDKPIGDFFAGTCNRTSSAFSQLLYFMVLGSKSLQVVVNSSIIPRTGRMHSCLRPLCAGLWFVFLRYLSLRAKETPSPPLRSRRWQLVICGTAARAL